MAPLDVGHLEFSLGSGVAQELGQRAAAVFALAHDDARALLERAVSADPWLRDALARTEISDDEIVVPLRLKVAGRSDRELARELAQAVVDQLIDRLRHQLSLELPEVGPAEIEAAKRLIARAKDWHGILRAEVAADGELGSFWREPLARARLALVSQALQQVLTEMPAVKASQLAWPGFTDELVLTFEPRTLPDPPSPPAIAHAIRQTDRAARRFRQLLEEWAGGEPEVVLATRARGDTSIVAVPVPPSQQAAVDEVRVVASLAQLRRALAVADPAGAASAWRALQQQLLQPVTSQATGDRDDERRHAPPDQQTRRTIERRFAAADAMAQALVEAELAAQRQLVRPGDSPGTPATLAHRARLEIAGERRERLVRLLSQRPIDVVEVQALHLEIQLLEPAIEASPADLGDDLAAARDRWSAGSGTEAAPPDREDGLPPDSSSPWGFLSRALPQLARDTASRFAWLADHMMGPIETRLTAIQTYDRWIERAFQAAGLPLPRAGCDQAHAAAVAEWLDPDRLLRPEYCAEAEAYVQERYRCAREATLQLWLHAVTRPRRPTSTE